MAQAFGAKHRETIDLSSGGSAKEGGGHWGSYVGLAIAAVILMAMVFLQSTAASTF